MTTKLGGITIADPMADYEGQEKMVLDVGAFHEVASGNVIYDYVGYRMRWILRWQGLTTGERNTIFTQYKVKTTQSFESPDGGTYTVIVVPNTWREAYIEDSGGTRRLRAEMAVELQAAAT